MPSPAPFIVRDNGNDNRQAPCPRRLTSPPSRDRHAFPRSTRLRGRRGSGVRPSLTPASKRTAPTLLSAMTRTRQRGSAVRPGCGRNASWPRANFTRAGCPQRRLRRCSNVTGRASGLSSAARAAAAAMTSTTRLAHGAAVARTLWCTVWLCTAATPRSGCGCGSSAQRPRSSRRQTRSFTPAAIGSSGQHRTCRAAALAVTPGHDARASGARSRPASHEQISGRRVKRRPRKRRAGGSPAPSFTEWAGGAMSAARVKRHSTAPAQ